jgi:hypothetical protein
MESATIQEVLAAAVAVGAGLYVLRRLTGWPRRKKKKPPEKLVKPTGRLAKGLDKARDKNK